MYENGALGGSPHSYIGGGVKGRLPKPRGMVQRRNKTSTRATLPPESAPSGAGAVPDLPKISETELWHPMVLQWWKAVWTSPMASEYLEADRESLYPLARLHQDFWTATSSIARQSLAAEIRQQSVRFGLSPIDRRRLQWEVEKGEQAVERTQRRKGSSKTPSPKKDPREVLKLA